VAAYRERRGHRALSARTPAAAATPPAVRPRGGALFPTLVEIPSMAMREWFKVVEFQSRKFEGMGVWRLESGVLGQF